jgi:hypothetical protein
VSFGKPDQHWAKTAGASHYIALRKFPKGIFVYDNCLDKWDGEPINGLWLEKAEYEEKIMKAEDMFVTIYLELSSQN